MEWQKQKKEQDKKEEGKKQEEKEQKKEEEKKKNKKPKREDNGGEKGGRRVGDIKEEVAKSEKEAKRLVPVQFHKWIHVFGKKQSEKIHCQERKEKRYMSSSKNN